MTTSENDLFALIEDGYVLLRKGGVFRPAKVYLRNGFIYANHGGGFVRLSKNEGATSCKDLLYEDLTLPFEPQADSIGRLKRVS